MPDSHASSFARALASRLDHGFAIAGGLALLAMAAVAFLDVVFRSFNRPVTGAYELTAVLVALTVFAALPGVTRRDEHVRAGLLGALAKRRPALGVAMRWLRRLLLVALFVYLAVTLWTMGQTFRRAGDLAPFIDLPLAWVAWFGAASSAVSALCALFSARGTGAELA
ncbi:MAG: TRAP transporter small permease subunit [Ferrovibrio sp.]|uniref:TRAP transporter small permease n=1 Tax=Ferrovibrio sp. TaxID=1917215 RepID=UPI00260A8BEA|nr:TRAP transporter small permease subunit [Ferrovibrio sp.]MCW0235728.1 TRAP transporter small permease subunit [Ferrovibrio sp.]